MSNRVEQLESTVAQLESTVQGLTEELVEAKERIRELEGELEPEPADGSAVRSVPVAESQDDEVVDGGDDAAADEGNEESADGGTGDESAAEGEESSPLGDDIIVA